MPVNIDLLTPGDGQGEETVSNGTAEVVGDIDQDVVGDIDQDCAETLAEDILIGHKALMEDIAANEETAAEVVRLAAGRKFDEVGPLEAAAAEYVLKKKA